MTPSPNFDPAAWQPEITIIPYVLDNGLKLLVLPDRQVSVVSVQLHYQVGSRHERPGITGISHLFEHLMFRGTDEVGPEEFSRLLQAKGGRSMPSPPGTTRRILKICRPNTWNWPCVWRPTACATSNWMTRTSRRSARWW